MYLHLAVPGFHAVVHQACHPPWAGQPTAVAIDGGERAPLFSVSPEAAAQRLHPGLRTGTARRRCPELRVATPEPALYARAHQALLTAAGAYSPRVTGAQGRLDADLGGTERLWRTGLDRSRVVDDAADQAWLIATALRAHVGERHRLGAFCGAGATLLVARLAARQARDPRHRRHGAVVVAPGWEERFLDPLPTAWLPDLDHTALQVLCECGLRRIGDLRACGVQGLAELLGAQAHGLWARLTGQAEEIVPELTLGEPVLRAARLCGPAGLGGDHIAPLLAALAHDIGYRLREGDLACRTLTLNAKWVDGRVVRLERRFPEQIRHDHELAAAASELLARRRRRVHWARIELQAGALCRAEHQLRLFAPARRERIEATCDHVRRRFGRDLVRPATIARATGEMASDTAPPPPVRHGPGCLTEGQVPQSSRSTFARQESSSTGRPTEAVGVRAEGARGQRPL